MTKTITKPNIKRLAFAVLLALILWTGITLSTPYQVGQIPQLSYQQYQKDQEDQKRQTYSDLELIRLRTRTKNQPEDLESLKALQDRLLEKLHQYPDLNETILAEIFPISFKIRELDPKDPKTILTLADLSFGMKAVDQAEKLYAEYISLRPDDLTMRTSYASTLTLLGRYDDALSNLTVVLAKKPRDFVALANMSLTYSQMGQIKKAKSTLKLALANAPSDEARARLSSYFDKALKEAAPTNTTSPHSEHVPTATDPKVVELIKNNPVAGPKFVSYEIKDKTLVLYFNDFPMQQMPPFAKDKFLGPLKALLDTEISELIFVDQVSGQEMERLSTPK